MNQHSPILIVEHHAAQRSMISESFNALQIRNPLVFVSDSEAVFTYLNELAHSPFKNNRLPGLIFLNLQLEQGTSLDLLASLKKDPFYCQVPVVVFSNAVDADDVDVCYSLGCNGCFQKPDTEKGYDELIQLVHDFWFNSMSFSNAKEFAV